jgi:uncharacterized membrane protein YdbT with pleckstrin-like domain
MSDNIIWSKKPSQILNLSKFIILAFLLILLAVLPGSVTNIELIKSFRVIHLFLLICVIYFIYTLFSFLYIFSIRYELTEERLLLYSGFLSQIREGVELYRVNDYEVFVPLYLRIFGLGNVTIYSTDVKTSKSTLVAIKYPYKVADSIRDNVEKIKIAKNIHFVKY